VEIPPGYVGLLFPRSSITKKNFVLGNSVGVIDSDYRGEITFVFKLIPEDSAANLFKFSKAYKQGERIGQLLLVECPKLEVIEVEELDDTERGSGGFGSSGQ
jgi:dUTP pyrophosphatase